MKTTFKTIVVILLLIIAGVYYWDGQQQQKRMNLIRNNIPSVHRDSYQLVECITDDQRREEFVVFMPEEITSRGKDAMNRFARGYCTSVFGKDI